MTKAADNSRKPSGDACGPSGASVDKARNTTAAALTKPAKLPLPERYGANPTTGEVLYEYICASEKLRAAAVLHIFDAWLQTTAKAAKADTERLAGKAALRQVEGGQWAGALTGAKEDALAVARKALTDADAFRREMRACFKPFPFEFLGGVPCLLNGGFTFADAPAHCPPPPAGVKLPDGCDMIDGLPFRDMITALMGEPREPYALRYSNLSEALKGAFDFVLCPTVDESLKTALMEWPEYFNAEDAKAKDAAFDTEERKEFRKRWGQDVSDDVQGPPDVCEAVQPDKTRRGRPAAFLHDLWQWQIWQTSKGQIWNVFEEPADMRTSGLPCSPKYRADGGQAYYYDRNKHEAAAARAAGRLKELEEACPVSLQAWDMAARICISATRRGGEDQESFDQCFAKAYERLQKSIPGGRSDQKCFDDAFGSFHKAVLARGEGDAVLTRIFSK
jgi:hypothetical protein